MQIDLLELSDSNARYQVFACDNQIRAIVNSKVVKDCVVDIGYTALDFKILKKILGYLKEIQSIILTVEGKIIKISTKNQLLIIFDIVFHGVTLIAYSEDNEYRAKVNFPGDQPTNLGFVADIPHQSPYELKFIIEDLLENAKLNVALKHGFIYFSIKTPEEKISILSLFRHRTMNHLSQRLQIQLK